MKRLLELDLLRTLVVVSENGSFTRAGEILHLTQAAVSMQIRRLEEIAGVTLISRDKRDFRLTDEGEMLTRHARRILELNDEAVADLSPSVIAGTVRIAAPDMFAIHVLPGLLAEFSTVYPDVRIHLQSGVSQRDIGETLKGLNFDLMIALEPAGSSAGLVLKRERAIWVASSGHEIYRKSPLPLALLREGSLLRQWALASLAQQGLNWREAYVCASGPALFAAIGAGLAIGPIRESSLRPGLRELGEADGFAPLPTLDITLLRSRLLPGRAARALHDFLAARLGVGSAA